MSDGKAWSQKAYLKTDPDTPMKESDNFFDPYTHNNVNDRSSFAFVNTPLTMKEFNKSPSVAKTTKNKAILAQSLYSSQKLLKKDRIYEVAK